MKLKLMMMQFVSAFAVQCAPGYLCFEQFPQLVWVIKIAGNHNGPPCAETCLSALCSNAGQAYKCNGKYPLKESNFNDITFGFQIDCKPGICWGSSSQDQMMLLDVAGTHDKACYFPPNLTGYFDCNAFPVRNCFDEYFSLLCPCSPAKLPKKCDWSSPTPQTKAPTSQTNAPTAQTEAPTSQTDAPTSQTDAPTSQTDAPTSQTDAPTSQTDAPTSQTDGPTAQTPTSKNPTSNNNYDYNYDYIFETDAPTPQTDAPTPQTDGPTTQTPTSNNPTSKTNYDYDYDYVTPQTDAPTRQTDEPTAQTNGPTAQTNGPTRQTNGPTTQTSDSPTSQPPASNNPTPHNDYYYDYNYLFEGANKTQT
jgi:hypothetical protein